MGIELFEVISYAAYEGSAEQPIYYAVVVGHGEEHHLSDSDDVAVFRFDDGRFFSDSAYGHDSYLGLVNDGRAHDITEGSDVGEGEGATLNFVWFELVDSGAVGEVVDGFGQAGEVELVGVFNYGHDEVAGRQGCGHSDINFFFYDNAGAVHRHVDEGKIADGFSDGFDEDGGVGNVFAGFFLEVVFDAVPPIDDIGDIYFYEGGDVWAGMFAHNHMVGDEFPHAIHFDDFCIGAWGSGACRPVVFDWAWVVFSVADVGQHIFFRDAAVLAASADGV